LQGHYPGGLLFGGVGAQEAIEAGSIEAGSIEAGSIEAGSMRGEHAAVGGHGFGVAPLACFGQHVDAAPVPLTAAPFHQAVPGQPFDQARQRTRGRRRAFVRTLPQREQVMNPLFAPVLDQRGGEGGQQRVLDGDRDAESDGPGP
jgi:hypothetical protein